MIINQIWDIGTLLVLILAKQKGCVQPDAIDLSFSIWHVLPLSCCWHRNQTHCFMEMCKSYQSNLAKPFQKSLVVETEFLSFQRYLLLSGHDIECESEKILLQQFLQLGGKPTSWLKPHKTFGLYFGKCLLMPWSNMPRITS